MQNSEFVVKPLSKPDTPSSEGVVYQGTIM